VLLPVLRRPASWKLTSCLTEVPKVCIDKDDVVAPPTFPPNAFLVKWLTGKFYTSAHGFRWLPVLMLILAPLPPIPFFYTPV